MMNKPLPHHTAQNKLWRKGLSLPLLLALLLGPFLALQATPASADGWVIECADCPKQFDNMTDRSLRLDAEGHPHIAYGGDGLYYAWHDGADWHYETVPDAGQYTSLALDRSGYPHISYVNGHDVKYAHKDASGWHIETVDSEGRVGEYTSLALDAGGYPHISYYDATNRDLKYTHSGPWLKRRDSDHLLILPARGTEADVAYGNIPTPTTLTATLRGPAIFADGSQVFTADITSSIGSYALHLKPAEEATPGDSFTLEVSLAGLQLERVGAIAWEVYLPLVVKAYEFDRLTYDPANDFQPALSNICPQRRNHGSIKTQEGGDL